MWADGTFSSNTAPLMGSLDDCARRASDLGYDALSLTVKDPNERDWVQVLRKLQNCGLEASGLASREGAIPWTDLALVWRTQTGEGRLWTGCWLSCRSVQSGRGKADHRAIRAGPGMPEAGMFTDPCSAPAWRRF